MFITALSGKPPAGVYRDTSKLAAGLVLGAVLALLLMWNVFSVWFMRSNLHMNDFGKVYYSTRAFLGGDGMYGPNPATVAPIGDGVQVHLWNLNPPHFHLLVVPFALLPEDAALVLWLLVNLLGLAVACALVRSELAIAPTGQQAFFWLLALLAFSGTAMVLVTGQFSFLLLLLLTLAWRSARRGRWIVAGAMLGTLIALKLFLAIFLPYLLLTGRRRALAAALGSLTLLFALGLLVFGADAYRDWFGRLQGVDWEWRGMNASAAGLLSRTFDHNPSFLPFVVAPRIARGLMPAISTFLCLITFGAVLLDAAPGRTDRQFLLLVLCSLLISPLGWTYYLWIALGPFAACLLLERQAAATASRRARWAAALVVLGGIGFAIPYPLVAAGQPNGLLTVTLGSAYFWSLLALWLAAVLSVSPVPWTRGWFARVARPARCSRGS